MIIERIRRKNPCKPLYKGVYKDFCLVEVTGLELSHYVKAPSNNLLQSLI